MKVIGYLRVSTDKQEESGLGLEAQEAKLKGYCALYDLELVTILQDAASGKSLKRDGLNKALAMLERGDAQGIIVAKLDRLTRSVKDLGLLLEDYFCSRFSLFVVAEQVDTRTAAGRLVLNLLTSVAQWERETIGERTRDALQAKKARGEKTGGFCPYGFEVGADGKLVENPIEQKGLRQALDLRQNGYSYNRIAGALNAQGIPSKTGSRWDQSTIMRIVNR